jgi:hypothetical protein
MRRTKEHGGAALWALAVIVVALGVLAVQQSNRRAERAAQAAARAASEAVQPLQARPTARAPDAQQQARQEQIARAQAAQAYLPVEGLLQRWEDAAALALASPRIQLADRVSALQALAREAESVALPACLETRRTALVIGLRGVTEGYLAFMADANLGKLLAQTAEADGRAAVQSFRTEVVSCRTRGGKV